jgi:hypothetical protein
MKFQCRREVERTYDQDDTSDQVEKSEFSLNSLGHDQCDDHGQREEGKEDPKGPHTDMGDVFPVNMELRKGRNAVKQTNIAMSILNR